MVGLEPNIMRKYDHGSSKDTSPLMPMNLGPPLSGVAPEESWGAKSSSPDHASLCHPSGRISGATPAAC